ncbi:CLUMA_CG008390, isoform A [Clunio marinus]|uniref:CLUMA_CG008390, isoform A n=1 Tax=Clunio marinus TaxID=568069 RepID=A0A1J1I568_9DIPT|nr:CLUMA_CG008390, isoform A [Clunio marinus]
MKEEFVPFPLNSCHYVFCLTYQSKLLVMENFKFSAVINDKKISREKLFDEKINLHQGENNFTEKGSVTVD